MMTEHDFIVWLRGFVEASHQHNLTPKAWETLKEKLKEVVDNPLAELLKDPNTFKLHGDHIYPIFPSYPQYPSLPNPLYIGDWPNNLPTITCNTTIQYKANDTAND